MYYLLYSSKNQAYGRGPKFCSGLRQFWGRIVLACTDVRMCTLCHGPYKVQTLYQKEGTPKAHPTVNRQRFATKTSGQLTTATTATPTATDEGR